MDGTLGVENMRPLPKSHLFLNKIRRISSIDRDIRKKWGKLQQQKLHSEQRNFQEIIEIQKVRHLNKEALKNCFQYSQPMANRIQKIRSEIIREEAHLRKKNYDDVFFRKKEKKTKLQLSPPSKSLKNQSEISPPRRIKTQHNSQSPLPLQKRDIKKQRELNVIQKNYLQDLRAISKKSRMEAFKIYSEQKDWLNKYKGSKVYYKIVSTWHPPAQ